MSYSGTSLSLNPGIFEQLIKSVSDKPTSHKTLVNSMNTLLPARLGASCKVALYSVKRHGTASGAAQLSVYKRGRRLCYDKCIYL
jgi:hypothetical protein